MVQEEQLGTDCDGNGRAGDAKQVAVTYGDIPSFAERCKS